MKRVDGQEQSKKGSIRGARTADFRLCLQDELIRRCQANPRYSLRAFARMLGVGPSYLSMILSCKRSVTPKAVIRLGCRLNWDPEKVERFRKQAAQRKRSVLDVPVKNVPELDFNQIGLDHFRTIADWYHYAILELVKLKGFQGNARWISGSLGISVNEVNAAVERLVRLKFLEIARDGRWINVSGNNTNIDNEHVASARRRLQRQILKMAITALEQLPTSVRDQSSITVACSRKKLGEAKERIKKFRRELVAFLETGGEMPDEVYHLSVSLYPVVQLKRDLLFKESEYEN